MIIANGEDYNLEVIRVEPLSINSHTWGLWKYRFDFEGSHIQSNKRYETEKGAKTAAITILNRLIRSKYKDNNDLAYTAAECMFINEYFKVMGDCEPPELFKSHKSMLTKVINAYIDEVEIKVI